jgi:hypothetical protein
MACVSGANIALCISEVHRICSVVGLLSFPAGLEMRTVRANIPWMHLISLQWDHQTRNYSIPTEHLPLTQPSTN